MALPSQEGWDAAGPVACTSDQGGAPHCSTPQGGHLGLLSHLQALAPRTQPPRHQGPAVPSLTSRAKVGGSGQMAFTGTGGTCTLAFTGGWGVGRKPRSTPLPTCQSSPRVKF